MFNIGWSEMLVIAAIALIVVGPKDLPAMLRQLGRAFGTVRRMGNEFKREINKVAALDEVKDIKESITEPLKNTHEELTNQFNIADENGVRPSGALKPKQEGVESVADEIREAVGMEPAPAPDPKAAAASMKAAVSKAQAKQAAEKEAADAEGTQKPAKKTRKAPAKKTTTRKTSAAKTSVAKSAAKKTLTRTRATASKKTTTAASKTTKRAPAKRAAPKRKSPAAKEGNEK